MRFSNSPWNKVFFKDIANFSKGNGLSKDLLSNKGIKCILYGELYTKYIPGPINKVISKTTTIPQNPVYSKKNDIILPASGESNLDISTACCLQEDNILLGGDLNIIRVSKHDGSFICYQLIGKRKFDVAKIAQGASIVHLHNSDLEKLKLFIPPSLADELKISSFLNVISERIVTQKKIIEDIELLKKQLRNNIFTVYYSSFQPLKNLYIKGKAGGTPKTTNKEYYDGDIPFLSITDITSSGKYIDNCLKNISKKGLENSSAWIVPAGSLILSMYASVGLPCINKIELATSQAMFSMILKKGINIDYIYEYLKYFKENKLETYLEKGTQSNINSNIVENILIPLPDEEKISKIVNILTSIDKKIDNEKSILQLYIKQKEYLLNKLFI